MTEFVRYLEGNYAKVTEEVSPQSTICFEVDLMKNIKLTVDKLTSKHVAQLPQISWQLNNEQSTNYDSSPIATTEKESDTPKTPSTNKRKTTVKNGQISTPRASKLEKSSKAILINSKNTNSTEKSAVLDKVPSQDIKSNRSILEAKSRATSKRQVAIVTPEKTEKSSLIDFKNPLTTIVEASSIKGEETLKEKKRFISIADIKPKIINLETAKVDHTKINKNSRSATPKADEIVRHQVHRKSLNNAIRHRPLIMKEKNDSKKSVQPENEIYLSLNMDGVKNFMPTNLERKKEQYRPISALVQVRAHESQVKQQNPKKLLVSNRKHRESSQKVTRSQLIHNVSIGNNDPAPEKSKSKTTLESFLKKPVGGPSVKLYRIGDLRKNTTAVQTRVSKATGVLKFTDSTPIGTLFKDEASANSYGNKHIKKAAQKIVNYSALKRAIGNKEMPRSNTGTPKLVNKQSDKESTTNMPVSVLNAGVVKPPIEYTVLNLMYGLVCRDSNSALQVRIPAKYNICEGNNGKLIENFFRRKAFCEFEVFNSNCNFQWSQTFHKRIMTTNARHLAKMQYKDLSCKDEFLGIEILTPSGLSTQLADMRLFKIENPKHLKSMFVANLASNQISLVVTEALQMCNHLRGISCIGQKTRLTELMDKYCRLNQIDFLDVMPKTFLIRLNSFDLDFAKMAEAKKKDDGFRNPVIIKPGENANRGIGISMAYSASEAAQTSLSLLRNRKGTSCVIVQYYISNPLLYRRRKFDIRCYGLVVRFSNRTAFYWYQDGYARTSSFEYSTANKQNLMIHLTNEAVQVKGRSYFI